MENSIRLSPIENPYLIKFEVAQVNLAKLSKEWLKTGNFKSIEFQSVVKVKALKQR